MRKAGPLFQRIKTPNFGHTVLFFVAHFFTTGISLVLYFYLTDKGLKRIGIIVVTFACSIVFSLIRYAFFLLVRKKSFVEPFQQMWNGVRRVADGDYAIQMQPLHWAWRTDEYDALWVEFDRMYRELASSELMKNDFTFNISHELKTPLAAIQNCAILLQTSDSEAERQEYAQKIQDASTRLSVLVGNILQINRLENKKVVVHNSLFNLSEQISRCAVGFEQIWEEKNIEMNVDFDQNITIYSDEDLLDIVWNNLISNALKFTEDGGTIRILAKEEGIYAVVRIEDDGCGISEVSLRHIFEKFYQADTSRSTQGNGLGLPLVKQIVELLGGKVSVDSRPGEGSAFTVKLQLTPS